MDDKRIRDFLLKLGLNPANKGMEMTAMAAGKLLDGYKGQIVQLYKEVGDEAGTSWQVVEARIRRNKISALNRNPHFYEDLGLPNIWVNTDLPNRAYLVAIATALEG